MDKKYTSIEEQVSYGLDTINLNEEVTLKTRDLIEIFKVFSELNRFFHQPKHYKQLSDVNEFLGNKDKGAYHLICKMYYDLIPKYIPKNIEMKFGEEDDPFENPNPPYYYQSNPDVAINDGTEKIKSKTDFIEFLKNYRLNSDIFDNSKLPDFLEALQVYSKEIDGYYKNLNFIKNPDEASWRIFAQLLLGASQYE